MLAGLDSGQGSSKSPAHESVQLTIQSVELRLHEGSRMVWLAVQKPGCQGQQLLALLAPLHA